MDHPHHADIGPRPVAVAPRPAAGAALVIFLAMFIGMVVLCALALCAVSAASGAGFPLAL